jgi:hypothetical protein
VGDTKLYRSHPTSHFLFQLTNGLAYCPRIDSLVLQISNEKVCLNMTIRCHFNSNRRFHCIRAQGPYSRKLIFFVAEE